MRLNKALIPDTNTTFIKHEFQIIDQISEKGGKKPNEDKIYIDDYSVLVFDGSTNLVEKEINAV